jgi:hypothetical protein
MRWEGAGIENRKRKAVFYDEPTQKDEQPGNSR